MPTFGQSQTKPFSGGGRQIQAVQLGDYRGGLNLRREAFTLGPNESPDMLNVNVDPRGGVFSRGGILKYGAAHTTDLTGVWTWDTPSASSKVVGYDGTNIVLQGGGSWSTLGAFTGPTVRAVNFKDKLYLQNGTTAPKAYDGSTLSTLTDPSSGGTSWNANLDSPNNGDMPIGTCITAHMGCVFVANTLEGGTRYPNRVRWSHPGNPEDWVDYHYIDVDLGMDGDEITGIQPFGDRLLIFKRRSVYALYGEPPEAFQVFNVTREIGAISQEAVAVSDLGVYFFSWNEGVFLFSGKGTAWQFDRLYPSITRGDIPEGYKDQIQLGWGNGRLWVSVPWESSTTRNRVFVLDPRLSKEGAWTAYEMSVGPFTQLGEDFVAAAVGNDCLVEFDTANDFDSFDGSTEVHFDSYYQTAWIDLGNPGQKKSWKRPDIILRRGTDATIGVEVYKDYDPGSTNRQFTVTSVAAATSLYGTAVYGTDVYSSSRDDRNQVERGSPLGTATAVSIRFVGPTANDAWGISGLVLKVIPKKVRG
jgi:hypothetical protein